jgi:shikimate kinase
MSSPPCEHISELLHGRSVVLVGMMGAGKTAVGRRLATALEMRFVDSDREIQAASGMPIADLFDRYGEAEFRNLERRVIHRILKERPVVLATGGGAFQDEATRQVARSTGVTIWLKADLEVLFERVSRRSYRPLLKSGNPRQVLARLMSEREPIYELADLTIRTADQPLSIVVDHTAERLYDHLRKQGVARLAGHAGCAESLKKLSRQPRERLE